MGAARPKAEVLIVLRPPGVAIGTTRNRDQVLRARSSEKILRRNMVFGHGADRAGVRTLRPFSLTHIDSIIPEEVSALVDLAAVAGRLQYAC